MPNINLHNVNKEDVKVIAELVSDDLVDIVGVPADWFNFIGFDSYIIIEKELKSDFAWVVVDWFKREEHVMDKIVEVLTEALNRLGYNEVTIYFNELKIENYYENGVKI